MFINNKKPKNCNKNSFKTITNS